MSDFFFLMIEVKLSLQGVASRIYREPRKFENCGCRRMGEPHQELNGSRSFCGDACLSPARSASWCPYFVSFKTSDFWQRSSFVEWNCELARHMPHLTPVAGWMCLCVWASLWKPHTPTLPWPCMFVTREVLLFVYFLSNMTSMAVILVFQNLCYQVCLVSVYGWRCDSNRCYSLWTDTTHHTNRKRALRGLI